MSWKPNDFRTKVAVMAGGKIFISYRRADSQWAAARLHDTPYPTGNHWIATKDDRRLNIIGTMHISDPRMDAVTEQLAPVIQSADVLLVEATRDAEQEYCCSGHQRCARPERLVLGVRAGLFDSVGVGLCLRLIRNA